MYREDWPDIFAREWMKHFVTDFDETSWICANDSYTTIDNLLIDMEQDEDNTTPIPTCIGDLMITKVPIEKRKLHPSLYHALCHELRKNGRVHDTYTAEQLKHEVSQFAKQHPNEVITLHRNTLSELIIGSKCSRHIAGRNFTSVQDFVDSPTTRTGKVECSIVTHFKNIDMTIWGEDSEEDYLKYMARINGPNNADALIHLLRDSDSIEKWYTLDMDSFVFPIIDSGSGGDSDNDEGHGDNHDDDRHEQDDVEPPSPSEDEHENNKQDEDGKYLCLCTILY